MQCTLQKQSKNVVNAVAMAQTSRRSQVPSSTRIHRSLRYLHFLVRGDSMVKRHPRQQRLYRVARSTHTRTQRSVFLVHNVVHASHLTKLGEHVQYSNKTKL